MQKLWRAFLVAQLSKYAGRCYTSMFALWSAPIDPRPPLRHYHRALEALQWWGAIAAPFSRNPHLFRAGLRAHYDQQWLACGYLIVHEGRHFTEAEMNARLNDANESLRQTLEWL